MWKKFLRKFRSIWGNVEDAADDIWDDVEPALRDIASAGGKRLLSIAYEAVQIAEKPSVSGADKLKQAKKHVLNSIKGEADSIGDHVINLAIHTALSKLKEAMGENT